MQEVAMMRFPCRIGAFLAMVPVVFFFSSLTLADSGEVEMDTFPTAMLRLQLITPSGFLEAIELNGLMVQHVYIGANGEADDSDGDGLDDVSAELATMDFEGTSDALGAVRVQLQASTASTGTIEEEINNTPGILDVPPFASTGMADSYFDVRIELETGGQKYYAVEPRRLVGVIRHKPCRSDTVYNGCAFQEAISLLDAAGAPTGWLLGCTILEPIPTHCDGDFDRDGDVDGGDLGRFAAETNGLSVSQFAAVFGRTDCLEAMTYHERRVRDYAHVQFETIRNAVDPGDETETVATFIGNHVEVKSENWVYVLDMKGHQIFRPPKTYPYFKDVFSPETDLTPILGRWLGQEVPQDVVDEAKRVALVALGLNYMGDMAVEVHPSRELVTTKALESGITRHHEGRQIILFNPVVSDEEKVIKYATQLVHDTEGEPVLETYPMLLPPKSFETAISFAQDHVIRVESSAPPSTPEGLEILDTFQEGLQHGYILPGMYSINPMKFGGFFSPDEWAFEYNAYAWQGEDFATTTTTLCPARPIHLPCHDDYFLDFPFFRNSTLYRDLFLSEWCDLGKYNGIRGNCLDYDPVSRSCLAWEYPRAVMHKDLGTYDPLECPYGGCKDFGLTNISHCDGSDPAHRVAYGFKANHQFYDDLEQCQVAMISTHGGQPRCRDFRFFQFKKEYETWVSLHREMDDGLGKGNLRHLFLQTCDSMGRFHSEKHGNQQIFDAQWMNGHIADGIRTICGLDGPASGKQGAHVTGLPFFSHYYKGDPIVDAFFAQELDACDCNTPVIIAFGGTPQEAASTAFDGRFETERAGTGHIMVLEVITPHLSHHGACCLPEPDPDTNRYCIDVPDYECIAKGGSPEGYHCNWCCPFYSDLVFCNP